jgi:hypothetical protein
MGNRLTSNKYIIESDDDIDEEIDEAIWNATGGPISANIYKDIIRHANECERKLTIIARETTI